MSESTIATLKAAGIYDDSMPSEQRAVLSQLSDEEAGVLTSVKKRLDSVGPDVEGHFRDGGTIF